MRTNKQMITREQRGVRWVHERDISVLSPLLLANSLSLRKKTREGGESGERERFF